MAFAYRQEREVLAPPKKSNIVTNSKIVINGFQNVQQSLDLFITWSFFFLSLVPPDNDVIVKNIQVGKFVPEPGNSTFSLNLSWTGPAFNFTFRSYEVVYELTGYNAEKPVLKTVVRNYNLPIS